MYGYRRCGSHDEGQWAGGRNWRRRGGYGPGFGWGRGMGGGDMLRAGRMLAQGDLRLLALALIAEQPRHGYEIIKLLEEKTAGWYSPSPGIVYPTLTYLEEAGYLTSQAEGSKKLYTITDEGRGYLEQNRDFVDAVMDRITLFGEKIARMRQRFGWSEDEETERTAVPPLVRAALDNLREAAAKRLEDDADAEAKVVDILARAAMDLRRSD